MGIVNKLIQASRLFGVEQEEYIKSNFNSISDLDVLFLSFIMSQKLKRLDITYCSNTEVYLGKEHFMYWYLKHKRVRTMYLSSSEIKAINILKSNHRIKHLNLLIAMPKVMKVSTMLSTLESLIENASVTINGVSEHGIIYYALRTDRGNIRSNYKGHLPYLLNRGNCILFTKELKPIVQGKTLLYRWKTCGLKILPPSILKLHGNKKYRSKLLGRYNFTFTKDGITKTYNPLNKVITSPIDWKIDEETFMPVGLKFKYLGKIDFVLFNDAPSQSLSDYEVVLHTNSHHKVKKKEIKLKNI